MDTAKLTQSEIEQDVSNARPLTQEEHKSQGNSLKPLEIDWFILYECAVGVDVDYDPVPSSAYLDKQTGELTWIYKDDDKASFEFGLEPEENQRNRTMVSEDPHRYLKLAGISHSESHNILIEFLESDWTPDEVLWKRALVAYQSSIGGWMRAIDYDPTILDPYRDYKEKMIREDVTAFLRKAGLEPIWKY